MKPRSWFPRLPFLRLSHSRFTLSALCFLLLMGNAFARKAKKPAKDPGFSTASRLCTRPRPLSGDLATVLAKMNQSSK